MLKVIKVQRQNKRYIARSPSTMQPLFFKQHWQISHSLQYIRQYSHHDLLLRENKTKQNYPHNQIHAKKKKKNRKKHQSSHAHKAEWYRQQHSPETILRERQKHDHNHMPEKVALSPNYHPNTSSSVWSIQLSSTWHSATANKHNRWFITLSKNCILWWQQSQLSSTTVIDA